MPQAFFRKGSVIWAELTDWSSVTRFVTLTGSALDVVANPENTQQIPSWTIALRERLLEMSLIACISSPGYAASIDLPQMRPLRLNGNRKKVE
jgi:hypothetical protein